jgi:hypothetical protein
MGGRQGASDAAAAVQALAQGPIPTAAAGDSPSSSSSKGKGKGSAAATDVSSADEALSAAARQALLAAGAVEGLLGLCRSSGGELQGRAAAVGALFLLLQGPGGDDGDVKRRWEAAGGCGVMVGLMAHPSLPLLAKAHAAGTKPLGPRGQTSTAELCGVVLWEDLRGQNQQKGC